jgi:hypothetical protein
MMIAKILYNSYKGMTVISTTGFEHIFNSDLVNYEKKIHRRPKMIESISGGIALVAFLTIFIMLVLFIDVIKSSIKLLKPYKIEPGIQVKDTTTSQVITHEKKLVYPFYVDYSRSIDPHQKYSSTT